MVYNPKQYDAARDFIQTGDDNVVELHDKLRVQCYDLYENLYINSTWQLKITIRGDESHPLLMPSGRKLIEATNRFLGINVDYLVEGEGDAGTQQALDDWWKAFFKREAFKTLFESNKRWGWVRGDSAFMLYANPNKEAGNRVCIAEVDPRQVFTIEDEEQNTIGYHVAERVKDWRDPNKQVCKRTTFRKELDDTGQPTGTITQEVTFWEIGKWDDRVLDSSEMESVSGGPVEPETPLPPSITQLPIYKWRNMPPQNSSWGISQLAGLETLMYGINQSLTDEDATIVFQGLGMYMTTAAPPVDPNTGQVTDWNIGPMQIIEVGQDQTFQRVSGVTDMSPYQNHMDYISDKGLSEAAGVPALAIGRVDVTAVQSGIAMKMELMPLIAANAEKELEYVTILDQMFHDITTMWLPAYESETFGSIETMSQMSVVCVFDDPMPVDRNAEIQETLLLQTSNLILTKMAIAKLRELGWKYPTTDDQGNALTDDDIVALLTDQASSAATAMDPFAAGAAGGSNLSAFDQAAGVAPPQGNVPAPGANGNTPGGFGKQTVPLG